MAPQEISSLGPALTRLRADPAPVVRLAAFKAQGFDPVDFKFWSDSFASVRAQIGNYSNGKADSEILAAIKPPAAPVS